jgi:hypothetical protein
MGADGTGQNPSQQRVGWELRGHASASCGSGEFRQARQRGIHRRTPRGCTGICGPATFVWQGQHYELTVTQPGEGVAIEDFVAFIHLFDIAESSDAITMKPKLPAIARVTTQSATLVVGNGVVVQCMPATESANSLPKVRGKAVNGGELWRIPAEQPQNPQRFLLAGNSATGVISINTPDIAGWEALVRELTIVHEAA